jgi:hypothetical protein
MQIHRLWNASSPLLFSLVAKNGRAESLGTLETYQY